MHKTMQAAISRTGAQAPRLASRLAQKASYSGSLLPWSISSPVTFHPCSVLSEAVQLPAHFSAGRSSLVRRLCAVARDHESMIGSVPFNQLEINKTRLTGSLTGAPERSTTRDMPTARFVLSIEQSGVREANNMIEVRNELG